MDKIVTVVIPGADDTAQARDVIVQPDNTVDDLLGALGKSPADWHVYVRNAEGDEQLARTDNLYKRLEAGQKLFLEPAGMVVG